MDLLQKIKSDKYSEVLYDFLIEKEITYDSIVISDNANDAASFALYAIQNNDKRKFLESYNLVSQRKPKVDSDWIHNETMLFAFTIGILKFNIDKTWIIQTLELKLKKSVDDSKKGTQSFLDVLNGNLRSTNNFQPLFLVLQYFIFNTIGDENFVTSVFTYLSENATQSSKSVFFQIVAIGAFNIIIKCKGLENIQQQKDLDNFVKKFKKRIDTSVFILWLFLIVLSVIFFLFFIILYLALNIRYRLMVEKIISFIPFLCPISIVIYVIKAKSRITTFIKRLYFAYYGYSPLENK